MITKMSVSPVWIRRGFLTELVIAIIALVIALYTFITKHRPYVWVADGQAPQGGSPWAVFHVKNGGEVPATDVRLKITWYPISHDRLKPIVYELGTIYPNQLLSIDIDNSFEAKSQNDAAIQRRPFDRGAPSEKLRLYTSYGAFGLPNLVNRVLPFRHSSTQMISLTPTSFNPMGSRST
jgi:hypothetical protein